MKPRYPDPAVAAAVWCVVLFALVPSMCAQEAAVPRHTGVPQDWSQHHIVFSRDALALHPNLIDREPRVLHQVMQRWQAPNSDAFRGAAPLPIAAAKSGLHRDWSVSPLGGKVAPFNFPAKFSFDVGAPPDCTNDYVVFGLNTASTGTQANLVAFNNLYSNTVTGGGLCDPPNGPGLKVLFAYDTTTITGGRIVTSPILSLDGTKIGFVESVPGGPSAIFHVLTWTAGQGIIGAAAVPTAMISVPFSLSASDSSSSPWIDYGNDIVYVGADNGLVYKITGVFHGVPALSGSPWPVTVSTGLHLTSPVLDSGLGKLMVGSGNGNLYQIDTATGALTALPVGGGTTSHGIVAAPLVDITNGTTFVVSANDGIAGAVLVEVDTATMASPPLSKARIGLGAFGGTALNIHDPDFSNNYYTTLTNGVIRVCGTGAADTTPWQYAFRFTGRTMHTTPSDSQQLLTSTAARCTGMTEFFNPNVGSGTDYFFFGLTSDCTGVGGAGGCVAEITDANPTTVLKTTVTNGPSGISVDNYSSAAEASSIYLTAEGVNTAYKFTQNGLF